MTTGYSTETTITDDTGRPVKGAALAVTGPDGYTATVTTTADTGTVRLGPLPVGDYVLSSGGRSATVPVLPSAAALDGAITAAETAVQPAALTTALAAKLDTTIASGTYATFPAVSGETGVLDVRFPPGDLRRYGISPDGTTNWYVAHRAKWDAAQANSALLGVPLIFSPGYYASGFEITASNVSARFEVGAEIGGLFHVISYDADPVANPIRNIALRGTLVTYDRFGCVNVDGLIFDRILVKFNGAKNVQDPGHGRGVHIYTGCKNFKGIDITVEDLDSGGSNNDAAVSFDNYPINLWIDRIHVKRSALHGVYITGTGHRIGEVIVDEWGYGTYAGAGLVGANGVPQSSQLKGVWLNRCESGKIGRIAVGQGSGSYPNGLYDVLIEETGHWIDGAYYPGSMTVDYIDAVNISGVSRGISFGDVAYPAGDISFGSRRISAKVAVGKAGIAGAGAVSVNEKTVLNVDVLRFDVDTFDALFLKTSTSQVSARLIDCGTHKYRGVYSAGRLTAMEVKSYRTSSGGGVSSVELIAGAEFSHLGTLRLEGSAKSAHRGLWLNGVADVTVDDVLAAASQTGGGAVALINAPRTKILALNLQGPGSAGTGLLITTSANIYLGPGVVTGFATGASSSGAVSGSAVGVAVTGNTTATNIPTATLAVLGCTTLQL